MISTQSLFEKARALHRAGDLEAAEPICLQIIEEQPDDAEVLNLLGSIVLRRGAHDEAIDLMSRAAAARPDESTYRINLSNAWVHRGVVLESIQREDQAEDAYHHALEQDPDNFDALDKLGLRLVLRGDHAEAARFLRRAVAVKPEAIDTALYLVSSLEALNELDEAWRVTEKVLAIKPHHQSANLLAAILERRAGRFEDSRQRLTQMLSRRLRRNVTAGAWFQLGMTCDRLGDPEAAYAAFIHGHEARAEIPETREADPNRYLKRLETNRDFFTGNRISGWTSTAIEGEAHPAPIFFVGFPRSGTTLMEEMLRAHPTIATTRERSPLRSVRSKLKEKFGASGYPACLDTIDQADLAEARRWYWEFASDIDGMAEADRLVEKLPLNIIELGLVARLFPAAPILVALRDPRDVVLSCFMQEFHLNDAMAHFTTLEGSARLYGLVMDLWFQYRAMPELNWMEYKYEDLVTSTEATARSVVEFIGEPWSADVLNYRARQSDRPVDTPSREALTQPINTRAIGRWRAYKQYLAPVLPILAPYVSALGYDDTSFDLGSSI